MLSGVCSLENVGKGTERGRELGGVGEGKDGKNNIKVEQEA